MVARLLEENKLESDYFMTNHFKDDLEVPKKDDIFLGKKCIQQSTDLSHNFDQEHCEVMLTSKTAWPGRILLRCFPSVASGMPTVHRARGELC